MSEFKIPSTTSLFNGFSYFADLLQLCPFIFTSQMLVTEKLPLFTLHQHVEVTGHLKRLFRVN